MRDVVGYEGLYSVTADGKVWRHPRVQSGMNCNRNYRGKWMSATVSGRGYMAVTMTRPGCKPRREYVHRLVAEAYLPKTGPEVNHKDGDKQNNCRYNLEWCDRTHNNRHVLETGLRRRKSHV